MRRAFDLNLHFNLNASLLRFFLPVLLMANASISQAETQCVAHRALGYGAIENSLEAIAQNIEQESWGLEIDIHHTKDGQSLVYHDKELDRLVEGEHCPIGQKISQLNFNEIRENCRLMDGQIIPSLREALESMALGNTKLFLEIKDEQITRKDYLALFEFFSDRPELIYFISFQREVLEKIFKDKQNNQFLSKTKSLYLKKNGNRVDLTNLDGIDAKRIHEDKVKRYQSMGKMVGVYTKNTRYSISEFILKGVDFITTDKIQLCNSLYL